MVTKKILCVFGTRPEAIKMAPVIMRLKTFSSKLKVKVCVTAQHRVMLDDVLRIFKIRPEYDLNVMKESQSLEQITKNVIGKVSPILKKEKPDLVLIHGDTSTTLLTALACFYQRVPLAHVEAGLRSYDLDHPFPEEANRRLVDALCALHFAPTQSAKKNLLKEGIPDKRIFVTGNTVIDALRWVVSLRHQFQNATLRKFLSYLPIGSGTGYDGEATLILVTAHRRENFGKPLENICSALAAIADSFPKVRILYPVHLNPNVQTIAKKILNGRSRILLLPPLNYLDFSHLLKSCAFVVTDSGGLQEEAPFLGKPVLVLRKVTERPEAVMAGAVRVIGTERDRIVREMSGLLTDRRRYEKMARAVNPYGDGKAAPRIVRHILRYFGLRYY